MLLMLILPNNKPKVKQAIPEVKPTVVKTVKLTPQQEESNKHDKWVEKQFTGYDGGRGKLIQLVKDNMNDPKSFKYVSSTRSFMGDDLIINMKFRGKNSFGAIVEQEVKCKVIYDDDSLMIIE